VKLIETLLGLSSAIFTDCVYGSVLYNLVKM